MDEKEKWDCLCADPFELEIRRKKVGIFYLECVKGKIVCEIKS